MAVVIAVSLGVGGGVAIAADLTRGPVPTGSNGTLNFKQAPDFISVVGSKGQVVGYVPRSDVAAGPANTAMPTTAIGKILPVFGPDLRTLVGHLYPGVGFVALGSSPASVSCPPETTIVSNGGSASMSCPTTFVSVPNVVGESTPAAAAIMSGLGLTVNVVDVPSASVPKGVVVSMSPTADSLVASRSVETIVNSIGPNTATSK